MKVLDASYLIDYLNGEPAAEKFFEENGGRDEHWVTPAPAYAEVLVGLGNQPHTDVDRAIDALSWVEVYDVDERLAAHSGMVADEIGPQGPFLNAVDALVAATGRELGATVVTRDEDLTHPESRAVVDVVRY